MYNDSKTINNRLVNHQRNKKNTTEGNTKTKKKTKIMTIYETREKKKHR